MTTINAVKGCDLCRNKGICKYSDVMRQVMEDYKAFAKESSEKLPDELKKCGLLVYHEPTCYYFSEYTGPFIQLCNCP